MYSLDCQHIVAVLYIVIKYHIPPSNGELKEQWK
jgi:hypothetical protein